jgi:hypothetical protein
MGAESRELFGWGECHRRDGKAGRVEGGAACEGEEKKNDEFAHVFLFGLVFGC